MRHNIVVRLLFPAAMAVLLLAGSLRAVDAGLPYGASSAVAATGQPETCVVLLTGFRIQAAGYTREGGEVRLKTGSGDIVVPEEAISHFETAEPLPPPPQAAAVDPAPARQAAAGPSRSGPPDPRRLIDDAARHYGLPAELLHSIALVESAYRQDAVSPKGARGIMQLMPATAAHLNADAADARQNVDAGARHIRDLLIQYDGATGKALAAYNAGAGAVARYGGIPPYRETEAYVQKVLRNYWRLHGQGSGSAKQDRGVAGNGSATGAGN